MRSRKYGQLKEEVPAGDVTVGAAVAWLKDNARGSFDETVEVQMRLGLDASKSDQVARGQVTLPAGTVSKPDIVVFTESEEIVKAVVATGAKQAGGEKLINEISTKGKLSADITIATPEMMPKVAKIARILGPKGLMPNPKTKTVSAKPADVVKELMSGRVSFKTDQTGNIHQAVAKVSWGEDKIVDNVREFVEAVAASKPAGVRGEFVRGVYLKSTMSPSIKISA